MNSFQIKVTQGSCEGKIVPVFPGEAVSIGRSRHSNNLIVLSEQDVSARHCMVLMDSDGTVSLEVLSDKQTEVDGRPLKSGDKVALHGGQQIRLGSSVSILLEQIGGDDDMPTAFQPAAGQGGDDDMPTAFQPAAGQGGDDMPTAFRSAAGQGGDDMPTSALFTPGRGGKGKSAASAKTAAKAGADAEPEMKTDFQTRFASFDELEKVKKKYQSRRILKASLIGLAVLLVLGLSVALFFWLRDPEGLVDWPADLNHPNARSALVLRGNIGLVFPSTLNYSVTDNSVEVQTAFGTKRDIPVHIQATVWDDPAGLQIDRLDAFHQYKKKMLDEDVTLDFDLHEDFKFVNTELEDSAGIPLNYVSYTRRIGNDDYFGYLIFFRYQIMNVSYLVEVPKAMQWKTGTYLKSLLSSMFRVANPITVDHWEGSSKYRTSTEIKEDLDDARLALQQNSPGEWSRVFYCVHSALIKSLMKNDEENLASARNLLVSLRHQQAGWFNSQRLAYLFAKNKNNKKDMQAIQAACEAAFPVEVQNTDYRYDLIKRKAW